MHLWLFLLLLGVSTTLSGAVGFADAPLNCDSKDRSRCADLANAGDATAQFELCQSYLLQVPANYRDAAPWCKRAASQGNVDASFWLASELRAGFNEPKNPPEAKRWFEKAASKGHPDAQYALCDLYLSSEAGPKEPGAAQYWCTQASRQGHVQAQHRLGLMYGRGGDLQRNDVLSLMWLYVVPDGSIVNLQMDRDAQAKAMTLATINEAQELAKQCKRTNYEQCAKLDGTLARTSDASPSQGRLHAQALPGPAARGWFVAMGPPANMAFEGADLSNPKTRQAYDSYKAMARAMGAACLAAILTERPVSGALVTIDAATGFRITKGFGPFADQVAAQRELLRVGWRQGNSPLVYYAASGCE